MPKLVVLYPVPTDVAVFEAVYREEHLPLVHAQMPGVQKFEAARVVTAGAPRYHWIAELHFDSMAALQEAMQSAGGQRTAGHALQISTGGAPTILVVDDPA